MRRKNSISLAFATALIASKMEADLLLILTDVGGLYTDDPRSHADAQLIPVVESITSDIEALADAGANQKSNKVGRGGIKTKLSAARVATQSGCAAIIAAGIVPFAGLQRFTINVATTSITNELLCGNTANFRAINHELCSGESGSAVQTTSVAISPRPM